MWCDLVLSNASCRRLIIIVSHIDLYRLFTFLSFGSNVFNDRLDAVRLVSWYLWTLRLLLPWFQALAILVNELAILRWLRNRGLAKLREYDHVWCRGHWVGWNRGLIGHSALSPLASRNSHIVAFVEIIPNEFRHVFLPVCPDIEFLSPGVLNWVWLEACDGLYRIDCLKLLWFEIRATIHFSYVASVGE